MNRKMKPAEQLILVYSLFKAVLCREFSISLPESVEALRGLCVLIPCSFEIHEQFDADLQRDPTVIWLKDGTNINNNRVFTSKEIKESKIEGDIIGDIRMKNCTTIFYDIRYSDSGVYYFRIETSGSLKHSYPSASVFVNVRDSPISPSIRLYKEDQGEVEDQNEVVEGTLVRIICSAPSPSCLLKPPTFTWNLLPEERRQKQNHNTSFSSSQLNFNTTHLHHGLDFTCTATYWLQNKNVSVQSTLTLHVLYGPKSTSVSASPSASVVLGSSVSLSCSSDANPAVLNYTWYRENGEQIGTGDHLTINTTDSHSGLYYCRAQNQHGNQNSSVYLDVQYGPRNTSVSASPSASVVLGSSVSLSCSSDANPAVLNYTWYRENGEQIGTGDHLTINTTDSTQSGLYYCRAQNQHGDHNSSVYLDVQYGPTGMSVSASPCSSVVTGSSVSLSCSSDANPEVLSYTWYRENGEQIGTGDHLTINITDFTHSGLYYCRAQNQHGDHNSSVYLDVQYGPGDMLLSASPSTSVVLGRSVSLSCSSDANPAVLNYTWYRENGEQIGTGNHLTINTTDSTHSGLYYCRAQNQHGDYNSSVSLDVQYAPRKMSVSVSPSALVVLGSSVSLSCSSDANPAVLNYTWYRENGEQIGTGDHLTINIIDSTQSGLYYCRAQNQHGDHNSSVYLDVQYAPRKMSLSVSPSASVVLGSSVSLRCSSDANPAVLNYTWYREKGEQIGTENHLTINTTDSTHSGLYYCRAQNQHGDHNSSVYLDVQYGPRNTSVSASPSATMVLGSSVSLSCSSDANPAVLNYTWYRENGEQIGTGDHLTINTTDSTHSGLYYCRAQNQHGDHNSSRYLDVQYGPRNTSVSASPSASVVLGSSVSLNCSSDANPAVLNYTWYRENAEQIGTGNHLTINTTDSTHSGLYYCRAQNQHGDHNSSVYLDVQYGPRNTSVSASPSASVVLGSSVSLSCSSDANPAVLNYTWYRENGEQIGTGDHLTINTTDSTHSGLYYCRAQNQYGDHNSSVYLDVQYGPRNTSVSASPSALVVLGSSVSLSCSSDANPSVVNYTWYRENGEQMGTGDHLTINTTDFTHSGLYYCRAQNQYGDHNSSVYLDVQYDPRNTLVSASPSATVVLGSSVSLSCSSDANPAVLNYTWYRENGEQIGTGNHLTINTTDSTHSGLYYCRAQNQHGDHNSSRYLDVQYGPRNTSVSASPSALVVLGSSVSLSCSSDANPAVLTYTWYRAKEEQIGTGDHLTINTTDSTHSGLYYCRAQNQHGDHNLSVSLDVQYAPQVSPSSSCNSSMDFFNCSCEVHGNPSPKLVWLLSGQIVSKSDIISTLEEASNTTLRSFMSIRPSANNTPTLQCVSTNNLGVTSQVFSFITTVPCSAGGVDISPVLIGAAAGASVMMMLCGVLLCVRKLTPSPSGRENTPGLGTVSAVCQEEGDYSVYVDKTDLEELLNYSTIVFPNGDGSEIRGLSKLTADYATIHHNSEQHTDRVATEAATAGVKEENGTNVDSEMMQEEEATYGNITRQPTIKQIS
ncbi:sialoadhesin-like isoform 2-T4 [Clarias gariepinus]